MLDPAEIDANAQRYFADASTIIDPERTEVRFNSEWLGKLDFAEILRLTRTTTVARILERDDFAKRFAAEEPISVSELLYPLMQAYDSLAVEYLDSWDGSGMSASRGNYVGLKEPPEEQFGKTMRIQDSLLPQWYRLVMEREPPTGDPLEAKLELARFVVRRAWGDEAAHAAEEHFTRTVRRGEVPADVPEADLPDGDPVHLPAVLVERLGIGSTSEARRLIKVPAPETIWRPSAEAGHSIPTPIRSLCASPEAFLRRQSSTGL